MQSHKLQSHTLHLHILQIHTLQSYTIYTAVNYTLVTYSIVLYILNSLYLKFLLVNSLVAVNCSQNLVDEMALTKNQPNLISHILWAIFIISLSNIATITSAHVCTSLLHLCLTQKFLYHVSIDLKCLFTLVTVTFLCFNSLI